MHTVRRIESRHRSPGLSRAGRKSALGAGAVGTFSGLCAAPADAGPLRELARRARRLGRHARRARPTRRTRCSYNTRFDASHPRAIVYCESAEDVQKTIRWARKHGDPHRRRARGGHSYGGYSTTSGVVVDVSADEPDRPTPHGGGDDRRRRAADRRLRALWQHGVAIPAGSCPTVGIAGLTLGGGVGYSSRKLGLTCDNVARLDDRHRRRQAAHVCNAHEHPDLFWACRGGGGGNFGIVTDFTLPHASRSATSSTYSIDVAVGGGGRGRARPGRRSRRTRPTSSSRS